MESKPLVLSFCAIFLRPEMQHIYRQVCGLRRYRTVVLTEERQERGLYPFERVEIVPRPRISPVKRLYRKFVLREPSLVYRGGVDVLRAVVNQHPDARLMHIYFGHTGVHLLPFIERWEKPVVVSFHGMDAMPRHQHKNYLPNLRRLFSVVPLVMARSHSLARVLIERGCPAEKIRINRTSVPFDAFPLAERTARVQVGRAPVIVQASRLIEKKGLDVTLRAYAAIRPEYPTARLVLAGAGPLQEALQNLARELQVADGVRFSGFLKPDQLNATFADADVFLHPSRVTAEQDQEGVPNSLLEAMATGLPVIATRHGGIPEVVEDGCEGFLCEENDVRAVAAALRQMLREPSARLAMGMRAAEKVRREFSAEKSITALEAIYDEAVSMPLARTRIAKGG